MKAMTRREIEDYFVERIGVPKKVVKAFLNAQTELVKLQSWTQPNSKTKAFVIPGVGPLIVLDRSTTVRPAGKSPKKTANRLTPIKSRPPSAKPGVTYNLEPTEPWPKPKPKPRPKPKPKPLDQPAS